MIEMDLPEGLVEEYIAVRDCLDAVHGKLYFPVFDGFERKDWPG
jgi:hypothetical protein